MWEIWETQTGKTVCMILKKKRLAAMKNILNVRKYIQQKLEPLCQKNKSPTVLARKKMEMDGNSCEITGNGWNCLHPKVLHSECMN